ncbi:MAG: hypothetical protein A2X23_06180 [Chloroflexi bacterium GWC2_73_18]|nr:MAG: hypothetical protein A2X23_06180 [Chloroflexi bacterium GWC2_73_18]
MVAPLAPHGHGPSVSEAHHWTERADSVAGVETALARAWAAAAAGPPAEEADGSVVLRTRTRVLTLVVVAQRPETAERALTAVARLAARHPSRAIVVGFGDPDGPAAIDARASVRCHLAPGAAREACVEHVLLRLGGEATRHPAAVAAPLLVHDLPVLAWWTDDPPIGSRPFGELAEMADRLLVDSGLFRDDGRERLVALAGEAASGRAISDIGWMRLDPWRELIAGCFDRPGAAGFLPGARRLRIVVGRPGSVVRLPKAALLAGWLASRLGWRIERPLAPRRGGERLVAAFRREGGRVELEIEPRDPGGGPTLRTPGSLLGVELELGRGREHLAVTVTRAGDDLALAATRGGVPVVRAAGRLERFMDAIYLARSLEAVGRDVPFEEALPVAAALAGG